MIKEELESICETLYRHLILEQRCEGRLTKQTSDMLIVLNELQKVQKENTFLKERVAYLERSNNRREDEIMSLREELIDKE